MIPSRSAFPSEDLNFATLGARFAFSSPPVESIQGNLPQRTAAVLDELWLQCDLDSNWNSNPTV